MTDASFHRAGRILADRKATVERVGSIEENITFPPGVEVVPGETIWPSSDGSRVGIYGTDGNLRSEYIRDGDSYKAV